ncbi:MAG TPA: methyltransferase domain-containing protein [Thermoanaerobaculia bacterium]|nr:methyltransferase domain-containing protein [Thermoanaerobaculia bacterium]
MTNDRRDDAAGLARELAAQLAALSTPEPNSPAGSRQRPRAGASGIPSLAGPRAILENASRFVQPALPADARFRSMKELALRALRIVTRDQGVFNSAVHEALRTSLLEIEAALAGLAAEQQARHRELGEEVEVRHRGLKEEVDRSLHEETEAQRTRLEEVRQALLSALDDRDEELRTAIADEAKQISGAVEREADARESLGHELLDSQKRLDLLESRSDSAGTRIEESSSRLSAAEEHLEKLRLDVGRATEELRGARLEWTTLRTELRSGSGLAAPAEREATYAPETRSAADPLSAGLYADFERTFRGAEDDIRARQEGDVSLFLGARHPIADLGCGRGEFLEALAARGLEGRGCDTNPVMVARCREKGLAVDETDLFSWLRAQPEGSLGGITAYQVVEHLPADSLLLLVELAVSRLATGGRLLVETVNAESVYAMKWFWMDLTHVRPVPGPSLGRLMEACGLREVTTAYRSPVPREETGGGAEPSDPLVAALARLVFAPQDVAVTGVK